MYDTKETITNQATSDGCKYNYIQSAHGWYNWYV